MSRPEFITQLNDLFKNEAPGYITKLKEAIKSEDLTEIGKEAHGLAGAARRIEATKLRDLCNKIETCARNQDITCIKETVSGLDDAYWDALYQANKTATDIRLERVEIQLRELKDTFGKGIDEMKLSLNNHLNKQEEILESIRKLVEVIDKQFSVLIENVSGKSTMPTAVAMKILMYSAIMVMMLIAANAFLLTGHTFGWLQLPGTGPK